MSAETKHGTNAVGTTVTEHSTLVERVNAALDEVRPAIHRDGGDVWLIRVDGRIALVQMVGACGGCAMAMSTLKGAIEATVTARCPEIERVEQI
ncbi:MAG: NifU family protein [Vulcanimicrobiaceae bacterium]